MAYATIDDVAIELGRASPESDSVEAKQWEKWLNRAERTIRARVPILHEWCEDEDYKQLVIDIESGAVARKALNPEGIRSVMTQIDDANLQKTIDTSRSSGEIMITDAEWELLFKAPASSLNVAIAMPDNPERVYAPRYPFWDE